MKDFFKIQEGFEFRLYGLDSNDEMIGQTVDIDDLYKAFLARMIDDGFIEANPKRWVRPKEDEIYHLFCLKLKVVSSEDYKRAGELAKGFYNHWNDLDWYRGKTRMKSYGGSINTWIKNNEKYKRSDSGKTRKLSVAEQVAANIAYRENENPANTEESGQIVADYG